MVFCGEIYCYRDSCGEELRTKMYVEMGPRPRLCRIVESYTERRAKAGLMYTVG
jgi:hypothetical protein